MPLFLDILATITLPILVLVALGFGVQRRLELEMSTLTRLQVHVILPCAIVHFLTAAGLPLVDAGPTALFTLVQFAGHFLLGWGCAALLGLTGATRAVVALAVAFPNAGNYSIPLVQLAFPSDYLLHQTIVMGVHSVSLATFGVWLMDRNGDRALTLKKTLLGSPIIPALVLGLAIKGLDVPLPSLAALPVRLMAGAYTPMALFILGAQLARIELGQGRMPLAAGVALKMAAAPALTWAAAWAFGFPGDMIALFVAGAAAPTGVMLSIFAGQYRVEPTLVPMLVFASTALSALGVTGWLYGLRLAGLMP